MALALAAISVGVFSQAAQAAVAGRMYIKHNGKIAVALDTGGSFYARGSFREMSTATGFIIKVNGTPAIAINQDVTTDREELGRYAYVYPDGKWEERSPLPASTGSLRFIVGGVTKMELPNPAVDTTWNFAGRFVEKFQYRKHAGSLSPPEQANFVSALLALQAKKFAGARTDTIPGGVSYWFKEDEIHQSTHNHEGPSFVPWHRELLRRFEDNLRVIDPVVSLPWWEWTADPRWFCITTSGFCTGYLGNSTGSIGEPFLSSGFYRPNCTSSAPCRNSVPSGGGESFWNTENPFDPPRFIDRNIVQDSQPGVRDDHQIVITGDTLPKAQQWQTFRQNLEFDHNRAHGNVGGNIGDAHRAFQDPFVYLLHAQVDRLFASWQRLGGPGDASFCPGRPNWRVDPACVYGNESDTTGPTGITTMMEPWANVSPSFQVRPWAAPESDRTFPSCTQGFPCPGQIVRRNLRDPSVVLPPLYDFYAE